MPHNNNIVALHSFSLGSFPRAIKSEKVCATRKQKFKVFLIESLAEIDAKDVRSLNGILWKKFDSNSVKEIFEITGSSIKLNKLYFVKFVKTHWKSLRQFVEKFETIC